MERVSIQASAPYEFMRPEWMTKTCEEESVHASENWKYADILIAMMSKVLIFHRLEIKTILFVSFEWISVDYSRISLQYCKSGEF